MTAPSPDPIHALIHAEAHAAVSRIAARHDFDRDMLDPEVVAECDRYGVALHTYCEVCHAEQGADEERHELWCRVAEFNAAMNAADAAIDRWRERELDAGGEIWEIDE